MDSVNFGSSPWDGAKPHEQLFVLITGANSGIGLGICQRLIDNFLATRSLTSHLILLPTTRSASKSLQTIHTLRAHAVSAAKSTPRHEIAWEDAAARVHILSPQLDLCDLRGVYAFAEKLVSGRLSNPEGTEGQDGALRDVQVTRLDSVVFNAAYGGWSGVDWFRAIWTFFTDGFVQSITWPTYKLSLPTQTLNEKKAYNYPAKPIIGEVFAACVFGHYLLAHHLLPLLNRPASSPIAPGRIIWSSSLEATRDVFNPSDIQGFQAPGPYESAKRLTDILSLTATLPSVRPYSTPFLTSTKQVVDATEQQETIISAKSYLTHPGIVASTLFPLPAFLFWAYELCMMLGRVVGSPWHTVDSYSGAISAAWIVMQEQTALDAMDAERIKWGSSSNRHLEVDVKKTEVEGWGWEGKVEDAKSLENDTVIGVFKKTMGRKRGVVDVTEDDVVKFEELGVECWQNMERLRQEWETIIGV